MSPNDNVAKWAAGCEETKLPMSAPSETPLTAQDIKEAGWYYRAGDDSYVKVEIGDVRQYVRGVLRSDDPRHYSIVKVMICDGSTYPPDWGDGPFYGPLQRPGVVETALAELRAECDKQKQIAANWQNMAAMHKAERDEARAECEKAKSERDKERDLNATLEAECERLREEGSPGVMHKVDAAFSKLTVSQRNAAWAESAQYKKRAEDAEAREREALERAASLVEMYAESYKRMEGDPSSGSVEYDLRRNVARQIRALSGKRREG